MSGYFSAEMVTELERRRDEVQRQYRALQERFIGRQYRSERAREYATQGFYRRLDVLARSVNFVFNILPPAEDDLPDNDDVVAARMFIQSFVINVAGYLDNLAWVWVYETDLKDKDGHELDRRMVGLGKLPACSKLPPAFNAPAFEQPKRVVDTRCGVQGFAGASNTALYPALHHSRRSSCGARTAEQRCSGGRATWRLHSISQANDRSKGVGTLSAVDDALCDRTITASRLSRSDAARLCSR